MPKPVGIGEVMVGGTVGEVVRLEQPELRGRRHRARHAPAGRTYAVSDGTGLRKLDPDAGAGLDRARRARHAGHDRLRRACSNIGQPKAGETVVVSAATGRGRLGGRPDRQDQGLPRRRHRRRRRTSAGTLIEELGFDACVDYRAPDFAGAAQGRLPEGHRRLFRECRRRGVGRGVPAAQRLRARAGLRADRASTT